VCLLSSPVCLLSTPVPKFLYHICHVYLPQLHYINLLFLNETVAILVDKT
jgi:hypothetical protein